jgi:hypothetical protein
MQQLAELVHHRQPKAPEAVLFKLHLFHQPNVHRAEVNIRTFSAAVTFPMNGDGRAAHILDVQTMAPPMHLSVRDPHLARAMCSVQLDPDRGLGTFKQDSHMLDQTRRERVRTPSKSKFGQAHHNSSILIFVYQNIKRALI